MNHGTGPFFAGSVTGRDFAPEEPHRPPESNMLCVRHLSDYFSPLL